MSRHGLSDEEKGELAELIDDKETRGTGKSNAQEKHQDLDFKFQEARHDFSDVVGMQYLKKQLREKVRNPVENREKYERYGIESTVNGMLLYGPPRVGKSYLTEGFAGETGYNFLQVNAGDILSPRVGVSEKKIKELVEQAVGFQPCIVLIDEVESLSSDRGSGRQQGYKQDLVSVFLNEMERLQGEDVVFVGTTNQVERVDEAFLQPGRFSELFFVSLPSLEMREELVRQGLEQAENDVLDWDDVELRRIAQLSEGYNCGDILEGVVYEAKLKALKRDEPIQNSHLLYGVENVEQSVVNQEKYRL